MAAYNDQKRRFGTTPSAADSGVAVTSGTTVVQLTENFITPIYTTKLYIPGLTYTVAVDSGGAADAQGQLIFTFPEGVVKVHAAWVEGTLTPATGVSAASAVFSLGSATGVADDAELTSTEADIMASQVLGDGTLASATAEPMSAAVNSTAVLDGTATAKGCYLNVASTWTKASGTTSTLAFTGNVTLQWSMLGDD